MVKKSHVCPLMSWPLKNDFKTMTLETTLQRKCIMSHDDELSPDDLISGHPSSLVLNLRIERFFCKSDLSVRKCKLPFTINLKI